MAASRWVAAPARWAVFHITSYQYADDVDILRGKHQIAFGVDYIRTRDDPGEPLQRQRSRTPSTASTATIRCWTS